MPLPLSRALPALGLFCALAAPATAQTPTELPLDTWVTGVLEGMDSRPYRLPADFTGWVEIVLESRDFDALLLWTATRDGIVVDAARNDDAEGLAGGGDSRLRVEVVAGTEGIIEASSYGSAGKGGFRIRASVIEGPPPSIPMEYGHIARDYLVEGDWDGRLQRSYTFEGNAGDAVFLTLESEDFDALLEVYYSSDLLAVDDDGLQGTDALLEMELPESGTYEVIVQSLSGDPGEYRLRLGLGPGPRPRPDTTEEQRASARRMVYLTQYGVMVPEEDAPAGLGFTEEERAPLVEDGSRMGSPALGFSLPSPSWGGRPIPPRDRLGSLSELARTFGGSEAGGGGLPTNVEVWGHVAEEAETLMVVVAARSDVAVDAEAMARLGSRILSSIGLSLRWMDIQWDESRSVAYRVTPDFIRGEGIVGAMRCRGGPARDRGGLIVCALGLSESRPAEMEAWLEGLEVR